MKIRLFSRSKKVNLSQLWAKAEKITCCGSGIKKGSPKTAFKIRFFTTELVDDGLEFRIVEIFCEFHVNFSFCFQFGFDVAGGFQTFE